MNLLEEVMAELAAETVAHFSQTGITWKAVRIIGVSAGVCVPARGIAGPSDCRLFLSSLERQARSLLIQGDFPLLQYCHSA